MPSDLRGRSREVHRVTVVTGVTGCGEMPLPIEIAAQERGEVAGHGGAREFNVPDENVEAPTAADLGLSRKDIHEARIIRDAEKADPGIVRRVLDEAAAAGRGRGGRHPCGQGPRTARDQPFALR